MRSSFDRGRRVTWERKSDMNGLSLASDPAYGAVGSTFFFRGIGASSGGTADEDASAEAEPFARGVASSCWLSPMGPRSTSSGSLGHGVSLALPPHAASARSDETAMARRRTMGAL